MQAQEYPFAKWAIALRMRDGVSDSVVETAFSQGKILRTHVMRPTWHFVTPRDIRWLLQLTAPGVRRRMSPYNRRLGLDAALMRRGARVIERALRNGEHLTRQELNAHLGRAHLVLDNIRLAHLVMDAELEGVICSGPRVGRNFTYALLAERAPDAITLPRDEALAELAKRFLRSHGPATVRDLMWWSGLPAADVRRSLEMNDARAQTIDGRTYYALRTNLDPVTRSRRTHLLPIYDEYFVAYRDREAVPHAPHGTAAGARPFVTFQHALAVDGQVAGTWRTTATSKGVVVTVHALRRLTTRERGDIGQAFARFRAFLDAPATLVIGPGRAEFE
jgi:hypothetical protein